VSKNGHHSDTRKHILQAALRIFADCGYAGTSIQQIVDKAGVSKPALYYYFSDKEDLFQALVHQAHDERYQLMQEAAATGSTVAEKLEEIMSAVFEFALKNRELMRLAFATAFAAPGETPARSKCCEKGKRNFEFIRSLIEIGLASGELNPDFSLDELAMGIYGQLNTHIMIQVLAPECPLNRSTAQRIVRLFFDGAARRIAARNGARHPSPPRLRNGKGRLARAGNHH